MANISAVRRDPVSGREVIFAPQRRIRPHDDVSGAKPPGKPATPCPFCPGNEAMLPDILWQREENGVWLSRAVPNRHPIVSPPDGHHEVIIETPRHSLPSAAMTADDWGHVLAAYSDRYRAVSARWRYLSLFRNAGKRAGGSLGHPHSQLIGLARMPGQISRRRRHLRAAYDRGGCCVLCEEIADCEDPPTRFVTRSAAHVAVVPDVAEVPFEVWIVPTAHSSLFGLADEGERRDLACVLDDVLRRMVAVLGDFDYNMMLIDATGETRPYLHWHLRLRPVGETVGGFELLTGIGVNPSLPDTDAAALRAAGVP